jgi:hypothetical protein
MKQFFLCCFLPLLLFSIPLPPERAVTAPFLSGDAFRAAADLAYDELSPSLDPLQVQPGCVVFVKTDYLSSFFEKIHPKIQHPYVIISHNSDDGAPGKWAKFLEDPRILAWFAQNYDGTPHKKMHPIPIGLANSCWKHGNVKTLEKVQKLKLAKKHLLYMNIAVQTFPQERQKVYDWLVKAKYCRTEKNVEHEPFLKTIASSRFIVSPRGNGLDTHRLWEALYLGAIPIVKSSSIDALYEGLPVFVVNNWEEVTEEALQKFEKEVEKLPQQRDKLTIDHWVRQIRSYSALCASREK